jgi:segregation and condensation protein B
MPKKQQEPREETPSAETTSDEPSTEPSQTEDPPPSAEAPANDDAATSRKHLRGLVEALVFASDHPIRPGEIAKLAQAPTRQIAELLDELSADYVGRGIQLEEIAGGYAFRTNMAFAPFVRDLVGQKPVKLTRAQLETLAIVAYRQPITRPDIDDVRGVDCGPVLRTLLERDLVRILGKKDEPGRPILYGTSMGFLQLFGLASLKDLPTLREFTELNEESRRVVERELGETMEAQLGGTMEDGDRPTLESAGNIQSPEVVTGPEQQPQEPAPPADPDEEADDDDDEWDDDDEEDDEDDDDEDDDDEDE